MYLYYMGLQQVDQQHNLYKEQSERHGTSTEHDRRIIKEHRPLV